MFEELGQEGQAPMSDIILTDENVTIVGPLVADGSSEITSNMGTSSGFAFFDRGSNPNNPDKGDRWVWYADAGTVRLYTDGLGDRITINKDGTFHGLNADGTSEITSNQGTSSGFAFFDRQTAERWVWYANAGEAKLYVDVAGLQDRLTLNKDGTLHAKALDVDGTVHAKALNVEGTSEITSSGSSAGFAFFDRKQAGKRWVWYAESGMAHLYTDGVGNRIAVDGDSVIYAGGVQVFEIRGKGLNNVDVLLIKDAHIDMANPIPGPGGKLAAGRLFSLDQNTSHLTLSPGKSFPGLTIGCDVDVQGNLKLTGTLAQASSRELKKNIETLSTGEAGILLAGIEPVKFFYKDDENCKPHAGFVAEELPALVTTSDGSAVAPLDIIAVLTKVVQDQQKAIAELRNRLNELTVSPRSNQDLLPNR